MNFLCWRSSFGDSLPKNYILSNAVLGSIQVETHRSQCLQGKRLQSEASSDCMDAHSGNAYTVGCHDGSALVCTVEWWNVGRLGEENIQKIKLDTWCFSVWGTLWERGCHNDYNTVVITQTNEKYGAFHVGLHSTDPYGDVICFMVFIPQHAEPMKCIFCTI